MTSTLVRALVSVVLVSTAFGVVAGSWALHTPAPLRRSGASTSVFFHPLVQWACVWALLFGNQIAFGAYVLRAHHGDSSFLGRYIAESGWFALDLRAPPVRWLASHAGSGAWLEPSVLRVQAFLELPFTLYAYLAVARMLGRDVMRALCRWPVLLGASVSFSVVFGIIEVSLPNPYTHDDLVLRALAAVTVPFWVAFTARRDDASRALPENEDAAPLGVSGLLVFLVGAGSIALALLVAYDVLLLYNLGHLTRHLSVLAVTWPLAAITSWLAPRVTRREASSSVALLRAILVAFTVAFFVPSLAIRYAALHPTAWVAAGVVVAGGVLLGVVRAPFPLSASVVLASIAGAAAGIVAGLATLRAFEPRGELTLAVVAVAFLGAYAVVAGGVERLLRIPSALLARFAVAGSSPARRRSSRPSPP